MAHDSNEKINFPMRNTADIKAIARVSSYFLFSQSSYSPVRRQDITWSNHHICYLDPRNKSQRNCNQNTENSFNMACMCLWISDVSSPVLISKIVTKKMVHSDVCPRICECSCNCRWWETRPQRAKFMGPTWGPPGSCRPHVGPMLAPWTSLSGAITKQWFVKAECQWASNWSCRFRVGVIYWHRVSFTFAPVLVKWSRRICVTSIGTRPQPKHNKSLTVFICHRGVSST